MSWARQWLAILPSPDTHLTDLSDNELRTCAAAYTALLGATASFKKRGGAMLRDRYGPTGAAKTLFALRPLAVPPWDASIRAGLGYGTGDLGAFDAYLTSVAEQLRTLAGGAGVYVHQLPALAGRPGSPPPKLIDEHNWIVITCRMRPLIGP